MIHGHVIKWNKNALLAICAGNSPVTGKKPLTKANEVEFDIFFELRPVNRLSKQSRRRWFETPSRSLRHRHTLTVFFFSFTYGGLAYVCPNIALFTQNLINDDYLLHVSVIFALQTHECCIQDLKELNCYSISFNCCFPSFVQIGMIIISKITSRLCICRHNFLHNRAWEYRVTDATSQQHSIMHNMGHKYVEPRHMKVRYNDMGQW